MIAPDLETAIDELQELVESARVIAPFTGAGISTECGIPDFRSPGGLWTKNRPIPFDEFLASQAMRDEAWRRRFAMEDAFTGARPGRGHYALASLYHAGKAPGVITQNIDNLHQDSGIAPADVVGYLRGVRTPTVRSIVDNLRKARVDSRIRAVLRRTTPAAHETLRAGPITADLATRCVAVDGVPVALASKEYELLLKLMTDPTRVFTKEQLLREVWDFRSLGRTRTLDSHASRLRRKLGTAAPGNFVLNVWGVGYRLLDG